MIDIRALAGAGPSKSASLGSDEGVSDLMSLGTASPLAGGLGAPVLAPVADERNLKPWIIGGVGAAALLVAAVVLSVVFAGSDDSEAPVASNETPAAAAAAAVTPTEGATKQAESDTEAAGDEG